MLIYWIEYHKGQDMKQNQRPCQVLARCLPTLYSQQQNVVDIQRTAIERLLLFTQILTSVRYQSTHLYENLTLSCFKLTSDVNNKMFPISRQMLKFVK